MKRIAAVAVMGTLLASTHAFGAESVWAKVNGMVCAFCAQGIEKTLRKNPATEDVVVSLEHQLVAVSTHPGQDIPDADLTKALTDAGYDVKGISRTQRPMAEVRAGLKQAAK